MILCMNLKVKEKDTSVNRRRIHIVDMKLPSLYREFIENGDIFVPIPNLVFFSF